VASECEAGEIVGIEKRKDRHRFFSSIDGCLNSAFLDISQHFTGHLFRPWIPSSARDIDGGPRRFTEVVLNEQWINGFSTNIIHAIIWPSAL